MELKNGNLVTFAVECDNGRSETVTYKLVDETEEELIVRVANHQNNEWKKVDSSIKPTVESELTPVNSSFIEVQKKRVVERRPSRV